MTNTETTETIKFEIELYAHFWDKPPIVEVCINDNSKIKQEITSNEDNPTIISFDHKLIDSQKYNLILKKSNKDNSQTIVEDGKIIKDQLLFIKSIRIDEIDIGGLIYEGKYYPEYPEPWASEQQKLGKELPEHIKNVTSMGHDGRWELEFTSPFYMWLLENLY